MDKLHDIDSTWFQAFERVLRHEMEIDIMRHENSVFHQITKQIPWGRFDRLVDIHNADHRVRRLSTKSHLMAMLFGQFSGACSLREVSHGLSSHASSLYHLGIKPAARSTLSDANTSRSYAVFAELFCDISAMASSGLRRHMRDVTCILDATRIRLSDLSGDWARFGVHHSGVKIHMVYGLEGGMPLVADITAERVNDILPARTREIEAGATYVFDLAYYDFAWWARLDQHGCRFVSRLKSHTTLRNIRQNQLSDDKNILDDCSGTLSQRMARSRKNPFTARLREIKVKISTGKTIRIVTNDLEAPAGEIAELYKQRWQVELFFKWIKQNLKIKRFMGTSENAVRIQIYVALIAFMLVKIAHQTNVGLETITTFMRLIRLNLMQKRPINALAKPITKPPINQNQLCFGAII